ncbi:MAG: autotransporter outer membrane beta-barrel domain-containing protein [Xanthomonadales bacterium]|nr:autotransporter outer membrane beta-barrel domain-containing protein [Xanthomonadales bacterium]
MKVPARIGCVALTLLLASTALPARAQTATEALAALWDTICATSSEGTLLFQRCDETVNSPDPSANSIAATGMHLEDIAGQGHGGASSAPAPAAVQFEIGGVATASLSQDALGRIGLGLVGDEFGGGWSLFASAQTGRLDHSGTRFESAFDSRNAAFTLGMDRRLNDRWVIGAALNHARDRIDYSGTVSRLDSRHTGLLLFANRSWNDAWSFDAYLGGSRGNADILREIRYALPIAGNAIAIINTSATSSPDIRRQQAGVSLDWLGRRGGWNIDLGGGIDLSRSRLDEYVESGGQGLALRVAKRTVTQRIARTDARFGRTVSTNWGVWQPSLQVGWRHAITDSAERTTIRFVDDPLEYAVGFDAQPDDRNWGEFAVTSSFTLTHGHSGFIEYRQRFAHDFLDERVLSLGWRIEL